MAHAGRGGNASLKGGGSGGESAISLLLAAVFLGHFVIFNLPQHESQRAAAFVTEAEQ